ncbi:MAG: hypothetical protein JW876_07405 [Candidatus Krumholzibacteriota bacterium]|nr:hypothetical protein [Candidatus Krumholzibacteriota bacterium]
MKRRIIVSIVITLVMVFLARYLSANRPRDLAGSAADVTIRHTTVVDQEGPGEPELVLDVAGEPSAPPLVLYRPRGAERIDGIRMTAAGNGRYVARLPALPRGKRMEYAFVVGTPDGEEIRMPAGGGFLSIKYEGIYSTTVLVLHMIFMFAAFFTMAMCLLGALAVLRGTEGKNFTVVMSRWVMFFTFVGGWPLGMILNQQAYGVAWEGFPFGWDVTDNKTQIMLVCWILTILLARGSFFGRGERSDPVSPRVFAAAVVAAFVISMGLFLVPHSLSL